MAMAGIQCTLGRPPDPLSKFNPIYDSTLPLNDSIALSLKDPFFTTSLYPFPESVSASSDCSSQTLANTACQPSTIDPGALARCKSRLPPKLTSSASTNAGSGTTESCDNERQSQSSSKSTTSSRSEKTRKSAVKRSSTSKKRTFADAKTEQERAKREEMLRKNREAAHKCRAKKKDWMTRMDEQHRDLSARNKFLRAELETLRESIFELKDLVLQHTDCGFAPIETYLQNAVADVQARVRSKSYPDVQAVMSPHAQNGLRAMSVTSYSTDMSDQDRMSPQSWAGPYGRSSPAMSTLPKAPEGYNSEQIWVNELQHA